MEQLAFRRGVGATAVVAVLTLGMPAWANSSNGAVAAPDGGSPALAAHYDRTSRILFIGSDPLAQAAVIEDGHVSASRSADLVGQPLRLVWSPRIGANFKVFGNGTMPSSMPVAARGITSSFGMREHPLLGGWRQHSGVDLAAPAGSPIVATSDGTVSTANWRGGYGLFVAIEHGAGIETRFGHMSRLNVVAGEQVKKGQVIGYVGSTGRSTGPHLHYEVRQNGRAINPAGLLGGR